MDEYEGDHEDIANYFSDLSNLPYVKFCIASRPLAVLKDAFSTCPALRLQDLTSEDIEMYVKDKLNGHKRMKVLMKKDFDSSDDLVQGVIYKAEGVFLWVTLVITALLKGLGQRDGFPQLSKRLERFPSDLERLYGHMLNSIDPIYMQEGARLFQIFKTANQMFGYVTAEEFYVAHIVDLPRVFGTTTEDLRRARNEEVELSDHPRLEIDKFYVYDPENLFEYMDHMVRTRCGGLIEINKDNNAISFATYLHRTVSEYLGREDIWRNICRYETSSSNFHPALQLLMCQVLRLKRLSLVEGLGLRAMNESIDSAWHKASQTGQFYKNYIPIENVEIQSRLLHEFDRQATDLSRKANILGPKKGSLEHWSNCGSPQSPITWNSGFLCEAISCGLVFYVENQLLTNQEPLKRESGLPLIGFTFLDDYANPIHESQLRILCFLLEQGADPNEMYEGHSMWQYYVHCLHTDRVLGHAMRNMYKVMANKTLKSFMEAGADLEICCIHDEKVWDRVYGLRSELWTDYLKAHSVSSETSNIGTLKAAGSSVVESNATQSLRGLVTLEDLKKASLSDEYSSNEDKKVAFEERHSLTAIFKDLFETEEDPHGADDLLELMATLKAAKTTAEGIQS